MQKQPVPNPVFAALEKGFNLMLANLCFLVCSLPVVTMGAALCGLFQVAQDQFYQEDEPVLRRFFGAFRSNFLQATGAWILLLIFLFGMGCNALMVLTYCGGWIAQMLEIVLGFLTAVGLSLAAYLFPLMVRYRNPLKAHLNNALILSVVKLPRTLAMLLLNTMIFWILFFSFQLFLSTMVFWLLLGFGVVACADTWLLLPVFRQMEEENTVDLMT